MDLNEASVATSGKRDVSLELSDGRGSSFSSEDSVAPVLSAGAKPRAASLDNRLLDTGPGAGAGCDTEETGLVIGTGVGVVGESPAWSEEKKIIEMSHIIL